MQPLTNYRAIWFSVAIVALYAVGVALLGVSPIKVVVDTAVLFVGVVISWSWAPAAWRAYRLGAIGRAGVVASLWLAWTALVVQRLWVIATRWNGRPDWMVDSPVNGLIGVLIFLAGAYAVAAPVSGDDVRNEVIHLIIAAAVGGLVVGAAMTVLVLRGL